MLKKIEENSKKNIQKQEIEHQNKLIEMEKQFKNFINNNLRVENELINELHNSINNFNNI